MLKWLDQLICGDHVWSTSACFEVQHVDGFTRRYCFRECIVCDKRELTVTGWGMPMATAKARFTRSLLRDRDARGRFLAKAAVADLLSPPEGDAP